MPATIIETNTDPINDVPVDPVDLDIIENALLNARHPDTLRLDFQNHLRAQAAK